VLATFLVGRLTGQSKRAYLVAEKHATTVRAAHTRTGRRSGNAANCLTQLHEVSHALEAIVPCADAVANVVAGPATVDLMFFVSVVYFETIRLTLGNLHTMG
jgi:hypothetical protein